MAMTFLHTCHTKKGEYIAYLFRVFWRQVIASSLTFPFLWEKAGNNLSNILFGVMAFSIRVESRSCAFSRTASLLSPANERVAWGKFHITLFSYLLVRKSDGCVWKTYISGYTVNLVTLCLLRYIHLKLKCNTPLTRRCIYKSQG